MSGLPAPLPLDSQLCFAIYSAGIAINRMYKPMLDGMGLTYPQFLVLSVLAEKDGQTVGAIAERLALESSTITPLVKRLEAAGFLRRDRNPDDERQVIVTLTDKARPVYQESKCLSEALLVKSGLKPADLGQLHHDVAGLRDALVRSTRSEPAPAQS